MCKNSGSHLQLPLRGEEGWEKLHKIDPSIFIQFLLSTDTKKDEIV